MLDVNAVRADFPIFSRLVNGAKLVYLDSAATMQLPEPVLRALAEQYHRYQANVHRGIHTLSEESTARLEEARERVRALLGARENAEIIFTSGTTQSINTAALALEFGGRITAGDAVVTTEMEHHSNLLPWQQLCARTGAELRVIPVNAAGELDLAAAERALCGAKLLAVTMVSNVTGCVNDAAKLTAMAHAAGAQVLLDAAQAMRCGPIDVQALDCDYLCFSGHKLLAPTGTGVLYGKAELLRALPPVFTGGGMVRHASCSGAEWEDIPYRFEAGTANIAGCIALGAALEYLASLGPAAVAAREQALLDQTEAILAARSFVTVYGAPARRHGAISFNLRGLGCFDTAKLLDAQGVAVRSGHLCAQPYVNALGAEGVVRVSPAFYNTTDELDAFAAALDRIASRLGLE